MSFEKYIYRRLQCTDITLVREKYATNYHIGYVRTMKTPQMIFYSILFRWIKNMAFFHHRIQWWWFFFCYVDKIIVDMIIDWELIICSFFLSIEMEISNAMMSSLIVMLHKYIQFKSIRMEKWTAHTHTHTHKPTHKPTHTQPRYIGMCFFLQFPQYINTYYTYAERTRFFCCWSCCMPFYRVAFIIILLMCNVSLHIPCLLPHIYV